MGNLRREMQLLNLLNGLELRASQMRFIKKKAQEAEEIRDELMNRADENIEETVAVLSELRATLMRGENITDSSRERWFSIHSENQELREKYQAEMTRIAREVKVILEGRQIYALEHFVPCVIPPKGGARIGQAEDTTAAEGVLAGIRAIPPPRFERKKEEIARRIMERLQIHLPRGFVLAISEEAETARILSILEEARGLSDVEFELQKTDLIQQLKSEYELPEVPIDTCPKDSEAPSRPQDHFPAGGETGSHGREKNEKIRPLALAHIRLDLLAGAEVDHGNLVLNRYTPI